MCGISGWLLRQGEERDERELAAMGEAMAHRGPDDRGYFVDGARGIALASNRLSIIDLSAGGHQPMASDDGDKILVYNGELYNFRELRKELEQLGHRFRSQSDTEVVLRSFEEWDADCVGHFCGMFALAISSARAGKLFLALDPMGMKSLYYTEVTSCR